MLKSAKSDRRACMNGSFNLHALRRACRLVPRSVHALLAGGLDVLDQPGDGQWRDAALHRVP
eukprot:1921932-Prymnesium_polylepis.1